MLKNTRLDETDIPDARDTADMEQEIAAGKLNDLLALAEAATLCGRDAYADYLTYQAERMCMEIGSLSLLSRVWN